MIYKHLHWQLLVRSTVLIIYWKCILTLQNIQTQQNMCTSIGDFIVEVYTILKIKFHKMPLSLQDICVLFFKLDSFVTNILS